MFCHNCGTKAIGGADFCQKCGAKLRKDEEIQNSPELMSEPVPKPAETPTLPVEPVSPPVETSLQPEQTPPSKDTHQQAKNHANNNINGNDTDIYALLKKNIGMCPVLKSAKRTKKGIRLCGKTYRYTVKVNTAQAKIKSVLSFPLSILYWTLAGGLGSAAGLILQELIKYHDGIYLEYYHYALFALCCLVAGAVILTHSFAGQREKMAVADYIREIIEPKQIRAFERKRPGLFKVRAAAASILVVTGIIVLIFNFPMPLKYPNELLFDGVPMDRFLDMTKEDIEAEFGEADHISQNTITGDDFYTYYSDGNSKGFQHAVYSKKTGKVVYIEFWGADCSYNRKNLDKPWYRVDDILQERSGSGGKVYAPNLYMFGTYGSVHTGFKYSDGVYFGDILDATELLAQKEFEDTDDKFGGVRVYEEGIADEFGMIPLEQKDYSISLIYDFWRGEPDPDVSLTRVSLYADEWVEAMNATLDASSSSSPDNAYSNFDESFPFTDTQPDPSDTWVPESTGSEPASPSDLVATFVEYGDEESWVTLYQDGMFAMQVNLYAEYGTLSGTYEETDWGFKFYVEERSFSGYEGDNVDEFEMVICDYGMEYRGDPICSAIEGAVYSLGE